jgi:hypothetical protein
LERYSDVDRDSGIVAYEVGLDFIRVKFIDGAVAYLYAYNEMHNGNKTGQVCDPNNDC